ncbi:MAG: hypothetical protein RR420_00920 [Anaerovoracaceae bacterium]
MLNKYKECLGKIKKNKLHDYVNPSGEIYKDVVDMIIKDIICSSSNSYIGLVYKDRIHGTFVAQSTLNSVISGVTVTNAKLSELIDQKRNKGKDKDMYKCVSCNDFIKDTEHRKRIEDTTNKETSDLFDELVLYRDFIDGTGNITSKLRDSINGNNNESRMRELINSSIKSNIQHIKHMLNDTKDISLVCENMLKLSAEELLDCRINMCLNDVQEVTRKADEHIFMYKNAVEIVDAVIDSYEKYLEFKKEK